MKTLLVTGYEPFAGYSVNTSWECANALPDGLDGIRIVKLLLPVEYSRGTELFEEALYTLRPDAVLSLGMAPGRDAVSIELMGFNRRDANMPDNAGVVRHDEKIKPDGADGYFTTLPNKLMLTALEDAGIPAAFSTSPGFYLCNNAMYVSQYHAHTDMPNMIAGFIHVPLFNGQSETLPTCPEEILKRGIAIAVDVIRTALVG